MNKDIIEMYDKALATVLEKYDITEQHMYHSNNEECVEARTSLIVALGNMGVSDKDIAECTKKMRRCSVCSVRNRYDDRLAPWTVKRCIEAIRGECGR